MDDLVTVPFLYNRERSKWCLSVHRYAEKYRPIVEQVFADFHNREIGWAYEERKHHEHNGF